MPRAKKAPVNKPLIKARIKTLYPTRPMFKQNARNGIQGAIDSYKKNVSKFILDEVKHQVPENDGILWDTLYVKSKERKRLTQDNTILKLQVKERVNYGYFLRTKPKGSRGQKAPPFRKLYRYLQTSGGTGDYDTLKEEAYALRRWIANEGFKRNYYNKRALANIKGSNLTLISNHLAGKLSDNIKHWAREVT